MSPSPARGRAGGKVILLGEHAVVYGRPAVASGVPLALEAEAARGAGPALEGDLPDDPRGQALVAEAARALGLRAGDWVVRVRSEIPPGQGLGSSAALCVATLRALAAAADPPVHVADELTLARGLEGIFHGTPSGIDPAASALGSTFRFVRGDPPSIEPIALGAPVTLVLALDAAPRSTGSAVGGLRARWQADRPRYERLFDAVAEVVEAGAAALRRGDLAALGLALDRNQELLEALGVSSPEIARRVEAARAAGALGAKLTGGGAGGAVLALVREVHADALARVLAADGSRTIQVALAGPPPAKVS